MIEYVGLAGVDIWVWDERAWGWYNGTKTLDGRLYPDLFKEHYNFKRANAVELKKLIRAVFMAKSIMGND